MVRIGFIIEQQQQRMNAVVLQQTIAGLELSHWNAGVYREQAMGTSMQRSITRIKVGGSR